MYKKLNFPGYNFSVRNHSTKDRVIEQVLQIGGYLGTRFTSNNRADEEIEHKLMSKKNCWMRE